MLVGVLGPVTLLDAGGAVSALPGHRRQALLAALAARVGEVVSVDLLTDLLWGEDEPPDRPAPSLHSAVFKLRANLGAVSDRHLLRTRDHGYQLVLEPGDLDASVFAELVQRARDEPPEQAAATLARALGLWRGPAYGGFADSDIARVDAVRLEEMRLTATERLGEALLAAGDPAEAIHLLQPFTHAHPLNEAARATLMRALQAAGRTADALDQYQQYRAFVGEEARAGAVARHAGPAGRAPAGPPSSRRTPRSRNRAPHPRASLGCRCATCAPSVATCWPTEPPAPDRPSWWCSAGCPAWTWSRRGVTPVPRCWSGWPGRCRRPSTTAQAPASPPVRCGTTAARPASRS
ncbi:AfsR/SARP family transcriptional regulator [Nocardioides ungokensis]|uniref:AfsR/SARP family transcriptional regulator n=1 Tax=Nocardioides ungokensis TaxID=1643322 RepID=UPI0015DE4D9D|nr:BTAD domain-containing putative transcriptional regulator [Nocardioides ungokensis]